LKDYLKKEENRIFIAVFVIAVFAACSPLFSKYCIQGHDLEYHLLRIEALKEGILNGKPFLKVNMLFFGGAGYASSMFYPDFLLYIPAILRVLGVGINASYHIFVAICIILCFLSTYFSTKGICKDKFAGIIAAVIMCLSNYFLDDIYVRAAVGEMTAFIFIPIVLYGIFNAVYEEFNKPQILAIGFIGLILSHTLSFAICAVITIIIFIINIKVFIKSPKLIIKLISTGLISAGISCSYWLPMLEQFLNGKFYVSVSQWIDPVLEAMEVSEGLGSVFPTLGITVFVFCIPIIFISKKEKDDKYRYAMLLIIGSILLYLASTVLFPWARLGKYLSVVQFPWRLYTVASSCLSVASGIVMLKVVQSVKLSKIIIFSENDNKGNASSLFGKALVCFVLIVMLLESFSSMSGRNIKYYDYSNDYYSYKPYTATVIAGEWLPETVIDKEIIADNSEYAIASDGSQLSFIRNKNELLVTVNNKVEYVDVPFIYYLGYEAETKEGISIPLDNSGNNGFIRIYPGDYTGNIRVYYKGTFTQHIAIGVSIGSFSIIVLTFICIYSRKKRGGK